jgi:NitT/TauT family transport system substrate-binding protein
MAKTQMTPFARIFLMVVILAGLVGGVALLKNTKMGKSLIPEGKGASKSSPSIFGGKKTINVCVNTWGGFAGGVWYNKGFKANSESEFSKKYGINVNFVLIDDPTTAREAWKADKVDLMWTTADVFPTFASGLAELEPQIFFQIDWSRGGDAIVVRPGITSFEQLKGKKVAVAFAQPSHTLLVSMLLASNLDYNDIKVVEAPSAIDAAGYFKAGQVDAAVVWSPDDEDCVNTVKGAKVLRSTKQASNIIADVYFAKRSFIDKHEKELVALVTGWLSANATLNSDQGSRREAAKYLADGMNQSEDFMWIAVNNAYLTTYGDNVNFFNLNNDYSGMTGEKLYLQMAEAFLNLGFAPAKVPNWRSISNTAILRAVDLTGPSHVAESVTAFEKAPSGMKSAPAVTTKRVTVNYAVNADALDDNAKYLIDQQFGNIAAGFAKARVRVEGNTDNTGDPGYNRDLSYRRAKSVATYLVQRYGFDPDRFIVVGNGPDNPIADNTTSGGRAKNRRTDFELLD